jgi:hypothetical protein
MKITDGLLLQQDLSMEISRLKSLAENKAWTFTQRGAGEDTVPTFDLEENHKRVRELSKLKRKLSRAISVANNIVDLDLDESEYSDWL